MPGGECCLFSDPRVREFVPERHCSAVSRHVWGHGVEDILLLICCRGYVGRRRYLGVREGSLLLLVLGGRVGSGELMMFCNITSEAPPSTHNCTDLCS